MSSGDLPTFDQLLARYRAQDLAAVAQGCEALLARGAQPAGVSQLAGLVEARHGRYAAALVHFDRALASTDVPASLHFHRGHALLALEAWQEALDSYERGLAAGLADPQALNNRGIALQSLKRPDEALASYARALELDPCFAEALLNRGELLLEIGQRRAGIACLQAAREAGGDDGKIGFTLASLGVEPVPAAPPKDFVRTLFDQYAERFDEHLTGRLGYRAPALVLQALAEGAPARARIADLGCGTGLCAPGLRPLAATLLGVDLSPHMLERAARLGLYDQLEAGDLVEWLAARPPGSLDIAVAADVLNYFGELGPVLAAAARALAPGGRFVFTVEALVGPEVAPAGFLLRPTRRYAHDEAVVRRLAEAAGYGVEACTRETLRREGSADVPGWLFSLRAGATGS